METSTQDSARLADPAIGAAVFTAQVDHLYRQLPRVLAYSLLVMLLIAWMLHDEVTAMRLGGWLAGMLVVLLARSVLYLNYRRQAASIPTRRWAVRFVWLAGLSGLTWGLAGVALFTPQHIELQALILLVLAGMGAGSAAVLPMYLPAFYAYFPISMLPAGIMMFSRADSFHLFMGVFDLVFTVGLLTFGRAIGTAFRTSLALRFENLELIRALREQKDAAEHANLAKSKFLAAASHDLRQPMHALMLFAEVLDQQVTGSKAKQLVDSIRTSVNALARLFDALLDISRLDAGVLIPERSVFPLRDVMSRVAGDYQPQANEKGLVLVCDTCKFSTETDMTLLERILRNLVANAIRYTPAGSVTLSCKRSGDHVYVSVTDTGIGIAPADQQRIYQEFVQLGNPERDRNKGLGLGLSIVKRLADLLRHPLQLQSTAGVGTTFTIQLPLRQPGTGIAHDGATAVTSTPGMLDCRVLVIDDDAEVRTGMSALLQSWGCTVQTAATSGEVNDLVASGQYHPDAIIADFRLPGDLTGAQLIAQVRTRLAAVIPALLISGDTEPARLQEARNSGLALLHKPLPPARLRTWLANVTRRQSR